MSPVYPYLYKNSAARSADFEGKGVCGLILTNPNPKNMFMKRVLAIGLGLLAWSWAGASVADTLFRCHARGGLPNVARMVRDTARVGVAYFGGSITEQNGWRVKNFDYLTKRYPQTRFEQINAAMGGTGSLLGVLRMDRDVLARNPDLVFVEFAVNDSSTPDEEVCRTVEGIVRKIWGRNPECDICFVYTTTEAILDKAGTERLHNTVMTMERVADYYGIPSVYLPYTAIELLRQGKLVMKGAGERVSAVSGESLNEEAEAKDAVICFSPDGVHLYLNTGHELYHGVLVGALEQMLSEPGGLVAHVLGEPIDSVGYQFTHRMAVGEMSPSGSWTNIPKDSSLYRRYSGRFDELWVREVGATLEFTFKGRSLICYDVISPEGCRLELEVDGEKRWVERFDGYCTYARLHFAELVSGLDPAREHRVRIRVSDEGLDKRQVLFEQNRADLDAHPKKYAPVRWYLNSIFAVE